MKNLKEYIIEGIFDVEDNIDNIDQSINDQIKQFLKDNFEGASSCRISNKPNADGKYEVSSLRDIKVKNKKITSLTNGSFIWTNVDGHFDCSGCDLLTSLEGAPKKVNGYFNCSDCNSLKSLKGAPEEVGGFFDCSGCDLLTSLKGTPEKVGGSFYCDECKLLTSLEGAPKKVGLDFACGRCKSLTSLKGAPKEVNRDFYCRNCRINFIIDDIKKISNIKGKIYV